MALTPRQMYYLLKEETRMRAEKAHHDLSMMALASQGSSKAIRAQLKALKKEMRK